MKITRTHLALGLTLLSAVVLLWALFGETDEDRILSRIKDLASAVETKEGETNPVFRLARLNKEFKEALEPNVTLSAPELPTTTGIPELSKLATAAPAAFGEIGMSVGETDITIDERANQARAVSRITLTG